MVRKALSYYRRHGILGSLKHAAERMGFVFLSRSLIFFQIDLNGLRSPEERHCFSLASKDDVDGNENYYDGWFERRVASERLRNGHRLFVYKIKEKTAYYEWVETGNACINWFNLDFRLPEDVAYITGLYTAPEARGRGIAYKVGRDVLCHLKAEGFKRAILVINPSNGVSIRMNCRLGFHPYQTVHYSRWCFLIRSRVCKYNSDEHKSFITLLKADKRIWNWFSETQ